ncbi:MAG: hypothetical protein ACLFRV_14190 [Acidimicrobiales bacterium]
MTVIRRAWQFPLQDARSALQNVRSVDALVHDSVGERVARIRSRESCHDLLVLARLAPDDDETWDEVLHPRADDFGIERAAAGRLTALLADLSEVLGDGGKVPPQFLEEVMSRAGWADSEVSQFLRGRRLPTLLRDEHLVPGDVVDRCEMWLPGGWLLGGEARSWAHQVDVESDRLERAMDESAEFIAMQAQMDHQQVREQLREGLASLSASYREASGIVWILQD